MISAYWAREALETYEADPTSDALLRLLQRLTEAIEEYTRGPSPEHAAKVLAHLIDAIETLNDDKADKPCEERGV